jgi:hypothetical protein
MRISGSCLAVAFVLAVAGCGGGTKTVTVDRPASAPASRPSDGASGPSGAADATGASGASGTTGAGETAPGTPLPTDTKGATAVQGRFKMRVISSDFALLEKGKEITWGAATRCAAKCVVDLQRQTEQGGFKRVELQADGPSRYAAESTGTTTRCGGGEETPTRDRTSLSVRKQRDQGGIPLATEIEGFVRVTYECNGVLSQKQVLRVRGRLVG